MSEIPEPFFFFGFEVRFVYCRKSDHCESLCFVMKALFTRTIGYCIGKKTTTTKPNEIELMKNPEQITNDLNNNMADLCDIIFKK